MVGALKFHFTLGHNLQPPGQQFCISGALGPPQATGRDKALKAGLPLPLPVLAAIWWSSRAPGGIPTMWQVGHSQPASLT